jgi:aminopeptidase N
MDGLLSTNSYQKGSWVLHMLRREVGDETFWAGIRAYYDRFRDGNALTSDLRTAMEEASGERLDWFFDQWVHRPGQPELTGSWAYTTGRLSVRLEQRQQTPFRVTVPLRAQMADGETVDFVLELSQSTGEVAIDLPAAPVSVTLDPDTWLLYRDLGFETR